MLRLIEGYIRIRFNPQTGLEELSVWLGPNAFRLIPTVHRMRIGHKIWVHAFGHIRLSVNRQFLIFNEILEVGQMLIFIRTFQWGRNALDGKTPQEEHQQQQRKKPLRLS